VREDWPVAVAAGSNASDGSTCSSTNGRYVGPGHMDPFDDTPVELIERNDSLQRRRAHSTW